MVQVGIVVNSYVLVQTLPTTTVAAQASVPRKDMSVVTAVRNVRELPKVIDYWLKMYSPTISLSGSWEGHWL